MRDAIALISFTEKGRRTLMRLMRGLESCGFQVKGFEKTVYSRSPSELTFVDESVQEWAGRLFPEVSALVFVGACGIAVRSVSPFLRGKDRDPAVLSVDEAGRFVIPLLSGHLGGANELAGKAAGILGAVPVITTATDLNRTFAVDLFARQNGLAILNLDGVKGVSSALLSGREAGFFCELPVKGDLPFGLVKGEEREWNIFVTPWLRDIRDRNQEGRSCNKLFLIPKIAVLGLGSKRGVTGEAAAQIAKRALGQSGLHPLSLAGAATIDLKRNEEGLLSYAAQGKLALSFYSASELLEVRGDFYESEFVKRTVGVSCVCERAAAADCERRFGPGDVFLACRRVAGRGVTAAIAVKKRALTF